MVIQQPCRNAFQLCLQPGDVFWCTADCGWVTGHTYLAYGPLLVGATQASSRNPSTTSRCLYYASALACSCCLQAKQADIANMLSVFLQVLFGSTPTYPTIDRVWEVIERYRVRSLSHCCAFAFSASSCFNSFAQHRLQHWPCPQAARDDAQVDMHRRLPLTFLSLVGLRCLHLLSSRTILQVRVFYTAPTLIRALMQFGDKPVLRHDRSSLRVLGTVGEPIGANYKFSRLLQMNWVTARLLKICHIRSSPHVLSTVDEPIIGAKITSWVDLDWVDLD